MYVGILFIKSGKHMLFKKQTNTQAYTVSV